MTRFQKMKKKYFKLAYTVYCFSFHLKSIVDLKAVIWT